jgi:hypothetical protein
MTVQVTDQTIRRLRKLTNLVQQVARIEGGLIKLTKGDVRGWTSLEPPKGSYNLRVVPAVNAKGLQIWHHATVTEMLRWCAAGAPGWNRQEYTYVIAAGSGYGGDGAVVGIHDYDDGTLTLTTQQLHAANNPNARLRAFLQATNPGRVLALCAVPRA